MVYSCDLTLGNMLSYENFPPSTLIEALIPVPGLVLVHTNNGVLLLNAHTLAPVSILGLSSPEEDVQTLYQFPVLESLFSVLKVWDVQYDPHTQPSQPKPKGAELQKTQFGTIQLWSKYLKQGSILTIEGTAGAHESCKLGLAVNNRILILHIE